MKIKTVTICGFRGFNSECSITLHPNLTLIYGPNSYGKTSITEAVEWLLYSFTSKVATGDSKDEFKGSYRNCHLDAAVASFVRVSFADYEYEEFKAELAGQEGMNRYVDGKEVAEWPIIANSATIGKPFIMQHALKNLLLVPPDQRFKGFAQLLGLDDLYNLQSDFVSLCTKPESSMPADVSSFYAQASALISRLAARTSLGDVYDLYKKGARARLDFHTCVRNECKKRVPKGTEDIAILPNLLKIRDEATKKVFSGTITLAPYTADDHTLDSTDSTYFVKFASEDLISKYCALAALSTRASIMRLASFHKVGMELLKEKPSECPFCGQRLDDKLTKLVHSQHQQLDKQNTDSDRLLSHKQAVVDMLTELKNRLTACQQRHSPRISSFLSIENSVEELSKIFLPKHDLPFNTIQGAIGRMRGSLDKLETAFSNVTAGLSAVLESVSRSAVDVALMKHLGECLIAYSKEVTSSSQAVSDLITPMSEANQVLRHELDLAAGTEDISVLIDLAENAKNIDKVLEIQLIFENLKNLRKTVDQYVASEMLDAIGQELSGDVMNWYTQIRTSGDPDVHFSGFDIDRTKTGDFKSRRVRIKASSYGKELVSAVSSLSESKLNVLGLCMSIAANLKPGCPFGFLFIDDPIQSLDEEHGTQFVDVVRRLVDSGKQVILLSHNKKWMESVRVGCRSLNGAYYEITGYIKEGPIIAENPWCTWKQRLDEADAIRKDNIANTVRLQQAEEEIRIAVCDLTAMIYMKNKGVQKKASTLNSASVRKLLLECGIHASLVDKISQTFETTDDSHHASTDYSAQRQRIKKYHDWVCELAAKLD